jgi:hypothetical protein
MRYACVCVCVCVCVYVCVCVEGRTLLASSYFTSPTSFVDPAICRQRSCHSGERREHASIGKRPGNLEGGGGGEEEEKEEEEEEDKEEEEE